MRLLLGLFISIAFGLTSFGQKSVVYFHLDKQIFKKKISPPADSLPAVKSKLLTGLQLEGYTGLTISDSLLEKDKWHYTIRYNKRFESVELINSEQQTSVKLSQTLSTINNQLILLENTGYPFAEIQIDSLKESAEVFKVFYRVDSGVFYTITKIHLKSTDDFNTKTVLNSLDIAVGENYSESKIQNLTNLLNQGGLYIPLRAPEILFKEDGAELFIYFKKKKSSNADGFIGFQQNPINQKLQLNGNINLSLKNAFNRAESVKFHWRSSPDRSQNLLADLKYPYLLNLPFGISTNMTIQKQDTTFLRNSFFGSFQYLSPYFSVGVFVQRDNSFLLGNEVLTNFTAFKKTTFGLESTIKLINLDRYRPKIQTKIGLFNFESDSLIRTTSSSNLIMDIGLHQEFKIFPTIFFKSVLNFKQINADYTTSENELFYFGGLNSVRGFYELELNGNTVFYALNTVEYKPIEALSFQLLYDYSQFHATGFNQTHSLGFGFNLNNDNNSLNFIIANGILNDNSIDFRNTKLHIGVKSNF